MCSQAPACSHSHAAPSPVHTHTRAPFDMHSCVPTLLACGSASPRLSPCRHRDTSRTRSPQPHGDVPTHAPASTGRHGHGSASAPMRKHHICFAHMLRRPVPTAHPTRAWHIQNPCSGCARTFLQTCTAGDPTHSLTQACAMVSRSYTLLHFTVI